MARDPYVRRTVVVGASSGLGRCIAIDRGKRGDRVALLARRKDRLTEAAVEAGAESVAIPCDVADEASCVAAIAEAAERLGGIDALVYSAGIGPLQPIEDISAETWRRVLDTNVVGAAAITNAALPHLEAVAGVAMYLTSVSASASEPWQGLGAYTVSKVALERLVDMLRIERPRVRFTKVIVGDCGGGEGPSQSEFPKDWDPTYAGQVAEVWSRKGLLNGNLMPVSELVDGIDLVIRSGAAIPTISLVPVKPEAVSSD